MNGLDQLRARLASLRRRRRLARWIVAYSALAVAVLWALAAVLLGDWLLDMDYPQRLVMLGACTGGVLWAFYRFSRPWLAWSESLIDMALLVQRQEQIDSDLVAALQFESPEAPAWGSVQLEQAVIAQAAEMSRRVRPVLDVPRRLISRRLMALLATLAVASACMWWFPEYLRTFVDRLLFRPAHYPTRTTIESVTINGTAIDLSDRKDIKCPYGLPLRLGVSCSGQLPSSGRAFLTTDRGGVETGIPLDPLESPGRYAGQWPRLADPARLVITAGDAKTDPLHLVVAPPPTVDVQFEVAPPRYAASIQSPTETIRGLRQLSVVEGSRVAIRVTSDKTLHEAAVTIEGARHPMQRTDAPPSAGPKETWAIDPAGTPLAALAEPVRYSIQVTDEDGLSLDRPIEGVIRIKNDRPPDVTASALTTLVLPTARPTIVFNASDDYGLAEVAILAEVVHGDGTSGEKSETKLYTLPSDAPPRKNIQERQRYALAPLKAAQGDQIRLTLRATDHRGQVAGRSTLSEPLVFQVTDERGIYAAMAEADRESARRLQTMIENQIDVGGGKQQ